jgi:hypothetical protein
MFWVIICYLSLLGIDECNLCSQDYEPCRANPRQKKDFSNQERAAQPSKNSGQSAHTIMKYGMGLDD